MKKYTLLIIMVLAGIAGYLYINKSTNKEFGALINLDINQSASFKDGLNITLLEINDSRCPKDVVCIWGGELSTLFKLTGGSIGKNSKEIRLGTSRTKSDYQLGYTITLESATEKTSTITVNKKETSVGTQGINGFVHIGPTCPVIQVGHENECIDKPLATAIGIYYSNNKPYKTINSGEDGRFAAELMSGTWIIRPQIIGALPRCEEKTIQITDNNYLNMDISCDSGIR